MRPPSYYTSLANSNPSTSSSYRSSNSTSSHFRSTFSPTSQPSSAYVTRTHLPYVPQSTLIAHCITGSGSTTRPYAQSGGLTSTTSTLTSYRPVSTKRHHSNPYLSSSTSSSSSSYLSPSSSSSSYRSSPSGYLRSSPSISSRSSYHRPALSSFYQPIRLRERPLLTQISRYVKGASGNSSRAARADQQGEEPVKAAQEKGDEHDQSKQEDEASWTSDVARNISRNKYLIKFREFDKSNKPTASPQTLPIRLTNQVEPVKTETVKEEKLERKQPEEVKEVRKGGAEINIQPTVEMKIPTQINLTIEREAGKPVESLKHPKTVEKPKRVKNLRKASADAGKLVPKQQVQSSNEEKKSALAEKNVCDKEKPNEPVTKQEPVGLETKKASPEKRDIKLKIKNVVEPKKPNDQLKSIELKRPEEKTRASEGESAAERLIEAVENKRDKPAQSSQPEKQILDVEVKPKKVAPKQVLELITEPNSPAAPPKVKVKRLVKTSKTKLANAADDSKPKDKLDKKPKIVKLKAGKKNSSEVQVKPEVRECLKEATTVAVQAPPIEVTGSQLSSPQLGDGSPAVNRRIRFREYHIEDFNFLSVLGHGGWGFVILAELKEHDACFAVKCIKKITIVEDDDFDSIMIERKVLTLGNVHPFICKLFCTFETPGYLFFAMEYCAGGDLMFHVQHEGKFTEPRCRFYAAEIICAIRFLHNRHIIYRDLKLDNILLDAQGHVRLVDFGMCQCRTYREEMLPSNFCGTPEYISPEIIKGVPYNHSVDWWSFGVLLYEMAVGKMPFRGNDENELLWNVCYEQIHYPMFLSRELTTLLQLLLEREPTKRMGMATCKAGDIYDQAWFRGTDWQAFEALKVKPPFVPEVRSKRDVQNFDSDFTESAPELSPVDESTLKRIDQSQFEKFPYTNPNIAIFDS